MIGSKKYRIENESQTSLTMAVDIPAKQALELVEKIKDALSKLQGIGDQNDIPAEPTDDELLRLPFD